ncbi:MAG: hypothetical protein ACRD2N_04245, partial [Vicinamibacterales bacterium]
QTVRQPVPSRACFGEKAIDAADVEAVRPTRIAIEPSEMTVEYSVAGLVNVSAEIGTASVEQRRLEWRVPRTVLEQHRFESKASSELTLPGLTVVGPAARRTIHPRLEAREVLRLVGLALATTPQPTARPYTRGSPMLIVDGNFVSIFRAGDTGVTLGDIGAVATIDSHEERVGECQYTSSDGKASVRNRYRVDVTVTIRELRTDRVVASTQMTGGDPPPCAKVMYSASGDSSRLSLGDQIKVITSPDQLLFAGARPNIAAWLARY